MNEAVDSLDSRAAAVVTKAVRLEPAAATPASVFRARWSILLLAWIIRAAAALNLYSSLLQHRPRLVHWLGPWVPFEISEGRRMLMFTTSVLLFILASALMRGKRIAWLLTIGALALAPALHLGRMTIWPQLLINGALIVFLVRHRRYFAVSSDSRSVRSALIICPLLLLTLILFGTLRLHDLVDETSGGDDWWSCTQAALELVLVQNTHSQGALTVHTLHVFSALRIGGASIVLMGLFLSLRPVLLRHRHRAEDRLKVRGLVELFGRDPSDAYAFLPDKHYFFTKNGRAVLPYALSGNIAVALAEPIGHAEARAAAITEYSLFCRQQDWEPVFYAVSDGLAEDFRAAGFSLFKIGEGALFQIDEMHLRGGEFQNLRTLCNGARKRGIQFRWYHGQEKQDLALERELGAVSHSWLEMKKAREMSFDMGEFSLEDIRQNGVGVAIEPNGAAIAFATWRPFAQGKGRVLDLMRHLPEARNVMDFVLVESILRFRAERVETISLGLAPLANTQESPSQLVAEEKAVQFLFQNLNHIYGYKSLFEFKRKYRPTWVGRYVAYRRGVHLPLVGLALVRVHAPGGIWKFIVG